MKKTELKALILECKQELTEESLQITDQAAEDIIDGLDNLVDKFIGTLPKDTDQTKATQLAIDAIQEALESNFFGYLN
jgi:hypothetical protein